jgi:3-hydroxyisobutyrate dehydrogenase-like beta-hydroxyacid dehydrogenase
MTKVRVGSIGLGNIGSLMAENVIRSGAEVAVYDVRPEAMEKFGPLGARISRSPRDAASDVDILTITVLNDRQVYDTLFGQDGALESLRPGSSVIVHSTVSPLTCQVAAARASEVGVGLIDAPFSGGEFGARDGKLTLMIGGSDETLAACQPVIRAVSERQFHVGDVGAGQIAKLVNNLMGIANRIVVAEALELARQGGLREEVVLELVGASSGNSWQVEHWRDMQNIAANSTTGASGMAFMSKKDLDLALQLAAQLKVSLPIATVASEHTAAMFTEHG